MTPRVKVPCAGCTLCCQGEMLILHPELGDNPADYKCHEVTNPVTGKRSLALDNAPNGDCIYLDRATGCTIHSRAPAICQEYDCRRSYLAILRQTTRADRKRLIAQGLIGKQHLSMGRKLLPTLEPSA